MTNMTRKTTAIKDPTVDAVARLQRRTMEVFKKYVRLLGGVDSDKWLDCPERKHVSVSDN